MFKKIEQFLHNDKKEKQNGTDNSSGTKTVNPQNISRETVNSVNHMSSKLNRRRGEKGNVGNTNVSSAGNGYQQDSTRNLQNVDVVSRNSSTTTRRKPKPEYFQEEPKIQNDTIGNRISGAGKRVTIANTGQNSNEQQRNVSVNIQHSNEQRQNNSVNSCMTGKVTRKRQNSSSQDFGKGQEKTISDNNQGIVQNDRNDDENYNQQNFNEQEQSNFANYRMTGKTGRTRNNGSQQNVYDDRNRQNSYYQDNSEQQLQYTDETENNEPTDVFTNATVSNKDDTSESRQESNEVYQFKRKIEVFY